VQFQETKLMPDRQTILIVENDQPTSKLYERVLQAEYEVVLATLDDDVLSLITACHVDAVVLEPGSMEGRGWSLLSDIKSSPELPAIPVVLCTVQDERRRGQELGSAAYLVKPVLPTTLLATLRRLTLPI
jgi:DNA-binding response OmpR family regulator